MKGFSLIWIFICCCIGSLVNIPLTSPTEDDDTSRKYNNFELFSIKRKCQRDPRYQRLPTEVVVKIRRLHIQKRRKRGRRGGVNKSCNNGYDDALHSNINNIIVATSAFQTQGINFGLINIRSLIKKDNYLGTIIEDLKLDFCIITETWLKDSDNFLAWKQGSVLNNDNWSLLNYNRVNKRGGGVAIAFNNNKLKINTLCSSQSNIFEYCAWKIETKSTHITAVGL